ncbi:MAG: pyrroloquinoline quinone biosynthesis protein PqqE [Gammaproteobacteria bacterium]|nr:pyrroloquinoline quinone biosynthesis protein PqqE [Gammaproteobacteria bacterium]
MPSIDLVSSGLASMQQGQNRMNNAASDIARAGQQVNPAQQAPGQLGNADQAPAAAPLETSRPVNLVDSLVELQQGRQEAEVGASVIDTADEVLGTLLDVTA